MRKTDTMIRISKRTTGRLKELGKKGDTYDQIINRLIDEAKKHEKKQKR
jgi:hypothetical protein